MLSKAIALARLFKIDESKAILEKMGASQELQNVDYIVQMRTGDYSQFELQKQYFFNENIFQNYASSKLKIQMTETMGRGVFAIEDIDDNELLIYEKGLVTFGHMDKV